MVPRCLKCEVDIPLDDRGYPQKCGRLEARFGPSSQFDQEAVKSGRTLTNASPTPLQTLLQCDEIRAYICDECFNSKMDFFEGYAHHITFNEKKIV